MEVLEQKLIQRFFSRERNGFFEVVLLINATMLRTILSIDILLYDNQDFTINRLQ